MGLHYPWTTRESCLDQTLQEIFYNSLKVDLRDDFVIGDLLYSISISNELYNTNLLWLPYFEISGPKVQYCTGRELLLFVPTS